MIPTEVRNNDSETYNAFSGVDISFQFHDSSLRASLQSVRFEKRVPTLKNNYPVKGSFFHAAGAVPIVGTKGTIKLLARLENGTLWKKVVEKVVVNEVDGEDPRYMHYSAVSVADWKLVDEEEIKE